MDNLITLFEKFSENDRNDGSRLRFLSKGYPGPTQVCPGTDRKIQK